jgi:hypothetical protein
MSYTMSEVCPFSILMFVIVETQIPACAKASADRETRMWMLDTRARPVKFNFFIL